MEPQIIVPDGYRALAWHSFPTLGGSWSSSKVHLASCDDFSAVSLCGARRGRRSELAYGTEGCRDYFEDAGQCQRCLSVATRRAEAKR
jgi:hypothetical protein